MNKKSYVQPVSDVLDIYTDEFMEGGFHAQSALKGTIESGEDADDPEESNPTDVEVTRNYFSFYRKETYKEDPIYIIN